jgi:DNA-binding protein YbaB
MKVKLLSALILFTSQFSFSQTIKGKVVFNNYAIPKVEVINASTKALAVSDANGEFLISAKTNDILVFVSKEHQLKKITINPKLFNKDELIVELILKAEELNEVVITNMPSIKLSMDDKWEQKKIDQYAIEKNAITPKVIGVNIGTIENGMNLMRIGGMVLGLFKKEKEAVKKALPEIEFSILAKNSYDQKFYLETLKLQTDEIELFLQFCEADPKSKIVAANNNTLSTMDFLFAKNMEFKKLAASKK